MARTIKTVLNIANYKEGEVEELEISELLSLPAPLDSQGADEARDQLLEELTQQSAKASSGNGLPTPEGTPEGTPAPFLDSVSLLALLVTIGSGRGRTASVREEISLLKGYELV